MGTAEESQVLRALFDREGTDKGDYAHTYELLLRDRRRTARNVLEVGIGTMLPGRATMAGHMDDTYRPGSSLRAWRDYFPEATVFGIDIKPDTQFTDDRVETRLCNSTNAEAVQGFVDDVGCSSFDAIIDDGSHQWEDQLSTLGNLWPFLAPGGLYFIEDVSQGSPLFKEPSIITEVVGEVCHFPVIDWVRDSGPAITPSLRSRIARRLGGPAEPSVPWRREWMLLVIGT